jgi:hypothetical protein
MFLVDLFAWWYGPGWRAESLLVIARTRGVLDAFSVGLLSRTLFAPFKQIDAGRVRGSADVQLRAWFDRTFSRVFGFFVRSLVIMTGCVTAGIVCVMSGLLVIVWPIVPLLPILGIVLTILGWTL